MTGPVNGPAPSSLQALIESLRDVHAAWKSSGAFGAAMALLRRKQRRNMIQLIEDAIQDVERDPEVIARTLSSGAAGAEAKAWLDTLDDAQKTALLGNELLAVRKAAVTERLVELKSLLASTTRGRVDPAALAASVGGLVDEFLPPAESASGTEALHPDVLRQRAGALARSVADLENEARDAANELTMNASRVAQDGRALDKSEAARDVVAELVRGTRNVFAEAERIRGEDTTPHAEPAAIQSQSASSGEISKDPFAVLSSTPFPRVSTPIEEPTSPPDPVAIATPAPLPTLSPLIDRFLERRCREIVGREVSHFRTNMLLSALAQHAGGPDFGALHVTCTDEAESESRERFLRGGIGMLLPTFSSGRSAGMATSNRGGCFELGTLRIAVEHFRRQGPVTMVVRVQSHCGVSVGAGGRTFGVLDRYGKTSRACGALQSILEGDLAPARLQEVAATIEPEHLDEIRQGPEPWRPVVLAALQARTQLERAMTEIRDIDHPATYILCGSINLNGLSEAAEIPVIVRIVEREGQGERLWEMALPKPPIEQRLEETPNGVLIGPVITA